MSETAVRVVQCDPVLGDVARNAARARDEIERARADEVDLLVFPELSLSGYRIDRTSRANSAVARTARDALEGLAPETSGLTAVVGAPLPADGGVYNAAAVLDDGAVRGTYAKTHLYDAETERFRRGNSLPVFSTTAGDLGVLVCYDCEFPEPARAMVADGADVLVSIWCNMRPFEGYHEVYARARAMENAVPHVACNRVGTEGDLDFFGNSRVVDQRGEVVATAPADEETVLTADLERSVAGHETLSYLEDRRPDLYDRRD